FGDYCSGTNHVLPTKGFSRCRGGLSVRDFVKIVAYQEISVKGAKRLALTAIALAQMEGLLAHKKSVEIRRG
ncbi:MAG: histidinol dehydrogenase, partial [Candidatus Diapherotrites archaeon]|nr:histidinol dehydrogenase [Candidatus Diapherotrites archaeon]